MSGERKSRKRKTMLEEQEEFLLEQALAASCAASDSLTKLLTTLPEDVLKYGVFSCLSIQNHASLSRTSKVWRAKVAQIRNTLNFRPFLQREFNYLTRSQFDVPDMKIDSTVLVELVLTTPLSLSQAAALRLRLLEAAMIALAYRIIHDPARPELVQQFESKWTSWFQDNKYVNYWPQWFTLCRNKDTQSGTTEYEPTFLRLMFQHGSPYSIMPFLETHRRRLSSSGNAIAVIQLVHRLSDKLDAKTHKNLQETLRDSGQAICSTTVYRTTGISFTEGIAALEDSEEMLVLTHIVNTISAQTRNSPDFSKFAANMVFNALKNNPSKAYFALICILIAERGTPFFAIRHFSDAYYTALCQK